MLTFAQIRVLRMKVFKFGGASVKDAGAIRNVLEILRMFGNEQLLVVISAMGKTTNALEETVNALWERNHERFLELVSEREVFHNQIADSLFADKNSLIFQELTLLFTNLRERYEQKLADNYNYEYDQIVSLGEVISTKIVTAFLQENGLNANWLDARKVVRTNRTYREGEVDWNKTQQNVNELVKPVYANTDILITQGFVGYTPEGFTTTLGREGSDYSAAIFAYCLDAEDVTIWKDVPGMLNADPKYFDNTIKLDRISFKEAIELSYYGASVIHPKTVKPLQNKKIPLYVKSFLNPEAEGTIIQSATKHDSNIPSFIFKMNQLLISITTKDFSFIVEEHLSDIFKKLAKLQVKINVMQNSALSFSILADQEKVDIERFKKLFEEEYLLKFNENLELVTIRHFDQATIDRVSAEKEIILEQKTRETARLILKNK